VSDILTAALMDLAEHPDSSAKEIAGRIGRNDRDVFGALDNAAYAGRCQRWRGTSGPWRWEIPPGYETAAETTTSEGGTE
jgi:hypothetical protein